MSILETMSEPYRISVIESLEPYGLGDVIGAGDKYHHEWRNRYEAWKYKSLVLRDQISEAGEHDPGFRASELEICSRDPAYWLTMYAWIEEPRTTKGESNVKPFIPFEFQVRLLQEFVRMVEDPNPRDLYVSKARGLGASWLFCAAAYWGWLFRPWRGKLVSRNQQLVDAPLDLDSLFGKVDFLLDWTPTWMLPSGYNRKEHRRELMLRNPVTGAALAGESTTSMTARGARSTYSIYDEAAFIRDFPEVWATGEATSTHRVGLSTESFSVGRGWYDTWQTMKKDPALAYQVMELEWWENSYQDQKWYEDTLKRSAANIEKFRREYERNPYEGSGQFIYEIARDLPEERMLLFDPTKPLLISIDPGHADDTAIVWGQETDLYGQNGISFLGSYERNYAPVEWYAHLLTGILPEDGDRCFGFDLTDREREELFPFFAAQPWSPDRTLAFMDPAGAQHHAGQSFFDLFVEHTYKLRSREYDRLVGLGQTPAWKPQPIIPMYQALKKGTKNHHEERRNSTRTYLPFCEVNNTLDGRRIKQCLINYQMSDLTDKSTSEMKPIHSRFSHIVTACEYLFSYMAMGFVDIGADFYFEAPPRVPLDYVEEGDDPWREPGMWNLSTS